MRRLGVIVMALMAGSAGAQPNVRPTTRTPNCTVAGTVGFDKAARTRGCTSDGPGPMRVRPFGMSSHNPGLWFLLVVTGISFP